MRQPEAFLDPQNAPNSLAAGASPQTPLGELTALPRPLAGFKGAASRQGGGSDGKREGRRMGSDGERKGREGGGEWEGRERTWDMGRGGKGKEEGRRGLQPPKLQFLAPPHKSVIHIV